MGKLPGLIVEYAESLAGAKAANIPITDKGFVCFFSALLHRISGNKQTILVCPEYRDYEFYLEGLKFYLSDSTVLPFPNYEVLPYDEISPEPSTVSRRIETLQALQTGKPAIVVATTRSFFRYLVPPEKISMLSMEIHTEGEYAREELIRRLIEFAYRRVDVVEEEGEFTVRGDIMDIYPVNGEYPVRIDFFDDIVEEMRFYDPETQMSVESCESVVVRAGHEVVFGKDEQALLKDYMLENRASINREYFNLLDRKIMESNLFSGIEALMPLLEPRTVLLTDYCPEKPNIIFADRNSIEGALHAYHEENTQEIDHQLNMGRIILPPDKHYRLPDRAFRDLNSDAQFVFGEQGSEADTIFQNQMSVVSNLTLASELKGVEYGIEKHGAVQALSSIAKAGAALQVVVRSASAAESISGFLEAEDISVQSALTDQSPISQMSEADSAALLFHGDLLHGFRIRNAEGKTIFCLATQDELYGTNHAKKSKGRKFRNVLNNLSDIAVNDHVVHEDYGVGVYLGLQSRTYNNQSSDFLVIEYRAGDKVFVPVEDSYRVTKYAGVGDAGPKLNSLQDKSWEKTKSKVQKKIHDMAEELVKIYAARKAKKGIAFSASNNMLRDFELAFPYTETEDQLLAITDVFKDMESETSMDRLICGDVGFGKTEVAMRAACKAALDGYQVAVLVPTTVLARQHNLSFQERFADMPVTIRAVSRLIGTAEIKKTLEELKDGKVDILIGTHRLLSKDVEFKSLGLLIIDEEQRFGVKHKERIRKYRTEVDTLSLSATPIPRTMQMSLSGVRDISLIATAPMDRRAIKTRVVRYNSRIISEAIYREVARRGQVYFVHNKVQDIEALQSELQSFMPDISIRIAHGQMPPSELEDVMMEFQDGKFQVLLCTTIIESGLDISNANTIIINNSDRFGLAQLYQIRGRVGRSNKQSYAYLLNRGEENTGETALKRLNVMRELTELGSGFKISSYDLALRGAGNMLGQEQSGHIEGVGINLYLSMVEDEVERIRQGELSEEISPAVRECAIITDFEKSLPDDYISNPNLRLKFYRQIAECKNDEELDTIRNQILDMYGHLPLSTEELFVHARLRNFALSSKITMIKAGEEYLSLKFDDSFRPDHESLLGSIEKFNIRIRPDNTMVMKATISSGSDCLNFIKNFVTTISTHDLAQQV